MVLRYGGHKKSLKGAEKSTTNNRMELVAAIMALESLKRPGEARPVFEKYLKVDPNGRYADRVRRRLKMP